jgi:hypothetical protein
VAAQDSNVNANATRKILWQKIAYGMSVSEVQALYPDAQFRTKETIIRDFQVTPECEANVDIRHENGTVESVRLRGGGAIAGRCADTVQAALGSRYGQPATQAEETGGDFFRRPSTLITWNRDGVTLRFKRFLDGGIGQRSWELEYSTYQDDIAL